MEDFSAGIHLSGNQLKLIAAVTMLIDHCGLVLVGLGMIPALVTAGIPDGNWRRAYWLIRMVGRIAFPIYCFLLTEGFLHTRSRKRYLFRLAVWGLISEIPFDLMSSLRPVAWEHQNVMFTLLIGLAVLWAVEAAGHAITGGRSASGWGGRGVSDENAEAVVGGAVERGSAGATVGAGSASGWGGRGVSDENADAGVRPEAERRSADADGWMERRSLAVQLLVIAAGCGVAKLLRTDYDYIGVMLIVLLYWYRFSPEWRCGIGFAWMALNFCRERPLFLWGYGAAFLLLYLYNGRRGAGRGKCAYLFYPAHMLVLWLIYRAVFGGR